MAALVSNFHVSLSAFRTLFEGRHLASTVWRFVGQR